MSLFRRSFQSETTIAQPLTTDPAARIFGGAAKLGGMGLAALALVYPAVAAPIGILAGAAYGVGGAVGAHTTQTANQSFGRTLISHLANPFKV